MKKYRMENNTWMPYEEYILRKEYFEKAEERILKRMMWGIEDLKEPREDENIKLAWVYINGKIEILGVDNKTYKGYRMEESIPTWKIPLESVEYDKFERWCTTFDV